MALLISLTPTTLIAEDAPIIPVYEIKQEVSTTTVQNIIRKEAKKRGVGEQLALDIAFCESSFRFDVYGDGGKAYSVYQFWQPTFEMFAKEYGKELDYKNWEHHVELAVWAFSKGEKYLNHWVCYKKLG